MILRDQNRGFTLVEMSVVLLVLSFLTGVIIYSKAIFNGSRAVRVIREYERIRSNVSLFYNVYGELPGNLSQESCQHYNEFNNRLFSNSTANLCSDSKHIAGIDHSGNNVTNGIGGTAYPCSNCDTLVGNIDPIGSRAANVYAMRMLNIMDSRLAIQDNSSVYVDSGYVSMQDVQNFFIKSYFTDVFWSLSKDTNFIGQRLELLVAGSALNCNFYYQKNNTPNCNNNASQISVLYNVNTSNCVNQDGSSCTGFAALDPILAYLIDKKIDDGLPYLGTVVSFKGSFAQQNNNISATDLMNHCTTLSKQLTSANITNISSQDLAMAKYSVLQDGFRFKDHQEFGCNMSFLYQR